MARCPTCGRRLLAGDVCPTHPTERAPERKPPTSEPPVWREPVAGCLGEGGFATVWEIHPEGGEPYALKVAKSPTELAARRMEREAAALAAVGSPWVPALLDHGVDEAGHAWLAMGLIRGDSLSDLIADDLSRDQIRAILRGLLEAVSHLHAAGIIHRDIKPDNVMVDREGRVTVLDLGMARRQVGDIDDPFAATIAGSAEYMAPEQLDSGEVTDRADVYALGVIAYEMCAMRPPFVGSAIEVGRGHRAMRPPRLIDAAPDIESMYGEALRKDPTLRPSVSELQRRLDEDAPLEANELIDDTSPRPRVPIAVAPVRDRPQPVVVMWAELARLDRNVLAMLTAHKFRIVSQRGRRVLTVILASDHATPSSEALAVAEELVALGARAVVHLAECVVTGERVTGEALEMPESWLPSGAWTGLRLSGAFAATVDRPIAPADDGAVGFSMLAEPVLDEQTGRTKLIGRDEELDELVRQIAPNGNGPGLVLVTGAVGVGKSTLAEALRQELVSKKLKVSLAAVTPPGRGRGPSAAAQVFSPYLADWDRREVMPDLADAMRALAKDAPIVMLLDDVDLAEHELLDAIEYMTLGGGERCALWIVCFSSTQLLTRRPDFGDRARSMYRVQLDGLKGGADVELAKRWLAPVDYVPEASLKPLLAVANGNPLHIVSLCRELHERGAIQQREDGGYFLDTSSLEQLPVLALGPWMATRQLAGLPEETKALARVCAVLGETFERDELTALVERLDESGTGNIVIDVSIGIGELSAAGLLEEDGSRLRFVNGLVCEGIYAMLDDDERSSVHRLALEYWQQQRAENLADAVAVQRIARHSRALNERGLAAETCAELARAADRAHRFFEAEQQWSAALQFLDDEGGCAEALVGRARARYRQQRMADAIADAGHAAQIARRIGDAELLVDALLEESTALDWAEDFSTSAMRAKEARECGSEDPIRQVRIALAEARAVFRSQPAGAASHLKAVVNRASELGDHETTVIAAMLAGHAFLRQSQVDRAAEMFVEGEKTCERSGDEFHFAALLVNRISLWSARGDIDRSIEDLGRAIQLAREHGQAILERAASYNLAEELLWRNQLERSFDLAQQSFSLQERYGLRTAIPDLLLCLRIAAVRNDRKWVESRIVEVPTEDLSPVDQCFRAALVAWLHPSAEAWRGVLLEADRVLDSEQAIEVGWLALNTRTLDAVTKKAFYDRLRSAPVWRTSSLRAAIAKLDDMSVD
jgi:eukaryotic-like serine/threonine-protein kinase